VTPPIGPANPDVAAYFREWLEGNGPPLWPFWESGRGWWAIRDLSTLLVVHQAELKAARASSHWRRLGPASSGM
jgi:aryl sulfotransferase